MGYFENLFQNEMMIRVYRSIYKSIFYDFSSME